MSDLLDEAGDLRRRICSDDPDAAAASRLASAMESTDIASIESARDAFYELPDELQRQWLNGWKPSGPRPHRAEILAAAELADVRRVLSIAVAGATIVPSHQWALCEGSPVVRIEIQEGATLEQVTTALGWIRGLIPPIWHMLTDPHGAELVSGALQEKNMAERELELRQTVEREAT